MMHRARDDTRRGEGKEGRTYQIDSSSIDRDLISCAGKTCKSNETAEPRTPIIVVCVTVERLVNPVHERTGKKEREEERNYTEPPKPSSCASERASGGRGECVECRHRARARERERKREQLAGLPRAPASFLASRRVCKLPRGEARW